MYGAGSQNVVMALVICPSGPPSPGPTSSVTSTTRRDSPVIQVNCVATPARASSALIISPEAPPASPAATTSWPNVCSTRATTRPLPPAR